MVCLGSGEGRANQWILTYIYISISGDIRAFRRTLLMGVYIYIYYIHINLYNYITIYIYVDMDMERDGAILNCLLGMD